MFWMNGRRGGGLFLIPGLLFGIYVILAVLNVAGIVIGAVFSGLAAAFSGIFGAVGSVLSGVGSGIGFTGSLIAGIVIGVVLYFRIRRQRNETAEEG